MMLWVWVALLAIFVIIEATTAQLLTIWFAVGSFAALVTSFLTDNILVQVVVFVVVSVVVLAATRPLVKKMTATKKQATNADMYIGQEGIVTEEITKLEPGEVKVDGKRWSAISTKKIKIGRKVEILSIDGVKLHVKEVEEKEDN